VLESGRLYKIAALMAELTIQQTFELALQHHRAGRLPDAERLYRLILAQRPQHIDATQNLGIIAQQMGRNDIAVDLIRRAIALKPDYAEAYSNLGNALKENGQLDESIAAFRRAIALSPNLPEAHYNLGIALTGRGHFDEAIAACRQAIVLKPDVAEAHNNLGIALAGKGELDEAIAACRQAIALRPNYAEAHSNLGNALRDQRQLDESIAAYRHAIALRPDSAQAHNNLGIALADQGLLDEAIAAHRKALELRPDYSEAHSNLIMALLYRSGDDGTSILAEHRRWSGAFARPLAGKIKSHGNDRAPGRRLRIGYLSGDLQDHPVGYFLLPLLENHDRSNFEIFCYSNSRHADDHTDRLKRLSNTWRDIAHLSDEDAAALIRSDAIDILVDLSAHTGGNRLLVLARKPAPVQVTYLAYPGTTGLAAIDYRFTDPHLDPPDQLQEWYTEKSYRLPRSYWCYRPSIAPEVSPPPAIGAGFITFGCLNNFSKVTPAVLKTWSAILLAVPDSHLILHAIPGSPRDRVRNLFAGAGIKPDRITFIGWLHPAEYMDQYRRIDIALDPFPYAGGTTTCNALWMGVPVITLAGPTAIGRGGVSILNNVGLTELIARSPEEYVQLAVGLANDKARLGYLRSTIREQMKLSPLMDAKQFAIDIENAYRQMWRTWLGST
jgi:protein O-GlcNAc transferase